MGWMMEHIEEFTRDGKSFMYIDFSGTKTNDGFLELINKTEPKIAKYPKQSLYTITNIDNIRFDSNSKKIAAEYLEHNKPYVKWGVVIGLDGVKKLLVSATAKMSGRTNIYFAFTKKEAIERLLRHE